MEKFSRKSLDRLEFYLVRGAILILTAISFARLIGHELSSLFLTP
jgi:hypothetical protein